VPYPFAHPAAILPLVRPMGRLAVPSALVIGSLAPDLWYLAPGLARDDSHSVAGLFWFCVPAGLLAYLAFHLLMKQPLLALLPTAISSRLARLAWPALPDADGAKVIVSLLAGAATHVAWDGLTHERWVVNGFQLLQHASTLLGSVALAGWLWRWFRRAPAQPLPPGSHLPPWTRLSVLLLLAASSAGWALAQTKGLSLPESVDELRGALRAAALAAAQGLALSSIGYAVAWKLLR
jgi:hypothetical protein